MNVHLARDILWAMSRLAPEDRRAALLDAIMRVVSRRGFARTRVSDIADEAGVSIGLLHRYFPTLDDALAEAFSIFAEGELADLAARKGDSARERLWFALDFDLSNDPDWRVWIDAFGEALHRPALHRTVDRYNERWRSELAAIIAEGIEAGEWRCADPDESSRRLLTAVDGIAVHLALGGIPDGRERANRWLAEALARELGDSPFAQLPMSS
jgi:AcrR family transcriptional regulator